MTEDLSNEEQGGFRSGRGTGDQIFILRKIGEEAQEKKQTEVVCNFHEFEEGV